MKIKTARLLASIFIFSVVLLSGHVFAAEDPNHKFGSVDCTTSDNQPGIYVSIGVNVGGSNSHCIPKTGDSISNNAIVLYLISMISFLTLGAGILSVGGIVFGGITYALAKGNPGKIQRAVTIIIGSVVALVLLFLLFAIFNFIVPGQIFK